MTVLCRRNDCTPVCARKAFYATQSVLVEIFSHPQSAWTCCTRLLGLPKPNRLVYDSCECASILSMDTQFIVFLTRHAVFTFCKANITKGYFVSETALVSTAEKVDH